MEFDPVTERCIHCDGHWKHHHPCPYLGDEPEAPVCAYCKEEFEESNPYVWKGLRMWHQECLDEATCESCGLIDMDAVSSRSPEDGFRCPGQLCLECAREMNE